MKKILALVALCMFGFSFNASAQDDDPPSKSQTAQKIVDGLYGAKGHCKKEDGSAGKWYPTKMTESSGREYNESRSNSSSSSNSDTWNTSASMTGLSGGLTVGNSRSNSSSTNSGKSESNMYTTEYECR